MAGFDPSVISEIGASAIPDVAGARARAYTLADLVNTEQLDRLRLNEEKKQQSDAETVRSILAKQDLSTAAGINKAASALTSAGFSEQGLRLMSTAQQYQTGAIQQAKERNEADLARLRKYSAQMDLAAQTFDEIRAPIDAAKAQGVPPAALDAMTRQLLVPAMQRLAQDLPEFEPQIRQYLASPDHLTYAGMVRAEEHTNAGQRAFEQQIKLREQTDKERHEGVEEGFRAREVAVKEKAAQGTGFTPEMADLQGAIIEKGIVIPSGFRGRAQQVSLYSGLLARNPGKSAEEIADGIAKGQISFAAEKKRSQVAAGIEGKIDFATDSLDETIPLAIQASAAVPRGKFVPWNKLKQMGEASISDPNLKQLKSYLNTISNDYDVLSARGGTDAEKRAHNRALFDAADSPEALQAALDAVWQEGQAAKRAGAKAAAARVPGAAPSATSPAATAPPASRNREVDWSSLK